MEYITDNGTIVHADNAMEVIEQLRIHARFADDEDAQNYMEGAADRAELQTGVRPSTANPEAFIAGLLAIGLLRKLQQEEKLGPLAAFAPEFRDPEALFGKWHPSSGKGTHDDPATFPWFEFSDLANRFYEMLYEVGWINLNFNWGEWVRGPEGQKLVHSKEAIASADFEDLGRLLTALVRNDRFCEGTLAKAYEDKTLLTIVERAEALLNSTGATAAQR